MVLPLLVGAALLVPIASALCQEAAQAENDFAFAEGLYGQENYDLALQKYLVFIEAYPEHPNLSLAMFRAGECNFRLGRYAAAAPWFEKVSTRFPDSDEIEPALLWLGDSRFKAGEHEQALAAYEALVAKFPDSRHASTAAYWQGESHYHLGRYEEAARAYEDALKRGLGEQEVPYALYSIGLCYLQVARPADAARYLSRVVQEHPDSPVAGESQYLLARALHRQGEVQKALAGYQAVIDRHGSSSFVPHARMGVADCDFRQERYEQAIEQYRAVVAQYPTHELAAEARLRIGDSLFHLERWEETAGAYEAAAADPASKWAEDGLYWLAVTRERQDQPEAALAAHLRLTESYPDGPHAGDAWLHVGRLKAAAGDIEGAVTAYETAAEKTQDPGRRREALSAAQWARYRQAQSPEALDQLAQTVRDAPTAESAAESAYRVGRAYFDAGGYAPALEMLTLLVDNHADSPRIAEARYLMAACHERLDRPEEARRLYSEVAEANAGSEYGAWAMSALVGMQASAGEIDQAKRLFATLERGDAPAGVIGFGAYRLAEALRDAERGGEATEFYAKSLKADPQGECAPWALVGAAWCRLAEEPAQALVSFEKVLDDFATSAAAGSALDGLLAAGQAQFEAEDYDAARQTWQGVLGRGAEGKVAGLAQYGLGWVLLRQDAPEQALEHFIAAAQAPVPADVQTDARYQAARLLADGEQWARAVELLEPLRTQTGEDESLCWALTLLGDGYLELGRPEDAVTAFGAVTERWPEHDLAPAAWLGLGKSHRALGRNEDAVAALRQSAEQGRSRVAAEARYELGLALREGGDTAAAAEELLKVAILHPVPEWAAPAQFAAGQCYEELGQTENAIRSYRVIERQYADQTQWAEKAAARIRELEQ